MSTGAIVLGAPVLAIWGISFCACLYIVFFMDDGTPKGGRHA